jgi:hypothetical protein
MIIFYHKLIKRIGEKMNAFNFNIGNTLAIKKAIKENIDNGILYNTCKCGKKAYKLIDTSINGIYKGKMPICVYHYKDEKGI